MPFYRLCVSVMIFSMPAVAGYRIVDWKRFIPGSALNRPRQ